MNTRHKVSLLLFYILIGGLLITSCKKSVIRKNYTGDFFFTSYNKNCEQEGMFNFCNYDTIQIEGTIELLDDDIILIKMGNEQIVSRIDKDGQVSLYLPSNTYNVNIVMDINGGFNTNNEIVFTYSESWSQWGHGYAAERNVRGVRM